MKQYGAAIPHGVTLPKGDSLPAFCLMHFGLIAGASFPVELLRTIPSEGRNILRLSRRFRALWSLEGTKLNPSHLKDSLSNICSYFSPMARGRTLAWICAWRLPFEGRICKLLVQSMQNIVNYGPRATSHGLVAGGLSIEIDWSYSCPRRF